MSNKQNNKVMEQTMQNIATTLASINAYLAVLTEEVEKKKKKSNIKKEECKQRKKRNVYYTKKTNGEVALCEDFAKNLIPEERGFYEGMMRQFPKICLMEEPLTWEQFKHLMQKYQSTEPIFMVMNELENFKKITSYVSAYRTISNWLQMRSKRNNR